MNNNPAGVFETSALTNLYDKLESNLDRLKADLELAKEQVPNLHGVDWCNGYVDGLERAIEVLEHYDD